MRPRFTDAQIRAALRQVKAGTPAIDVCRTLGITQTTFYRWRRKADGVIATEGQEVRTLRHENRKLKALVAKLLSEKL